MQSSPSALPCVAVCALAALIAGPLSAAQISTGTSCMISGGSTVTNSASCSLSGPGQAMSHANSTASFATVSNSFSTVITESVGAVAPFNGSSLSTASASLDINLVTDGPVRSGFVEVISNANWGVALDGFVGSLGYFLGSSGGGSCSASSSVTCSNLSGFIPFTLGTSFQFNETQTFNANPIYITSGSSSGQGTTSLQFLFFEADQSTPVGVSDPVGAATPEPGTCALFACGLLLAGACRIRSLPVMARLRNRGR